MAIAVEMWMMVTGTTMNVSTRPIIIVAPILTNTLMLSITMRVDITIILGKKDDDGDNDDGDAELGRHGIITINDQKTTKMMWHTLRGMVSTLPAMETMLLIIMEANTEGGDGHAIADDDGSDYSTRSYMAKLARLVQRPAACARI